MDMKIGLYFVFVIGLNSVAGHPFEGNSLDSDNDAIDLSRLADTIFGEPDEAVGRALKEWSGTGVNPEELGTYLEGDILMPIDQVQGRNGISPESFRWPNARIPFVISGNFNAMQMQMIEEAMNIYHTKTCIRFVPRSNEVDFVAIDNSNTGCWSSVGKIGQRQTVNLQTPDCMGKIGTCLHEFLHAIGFMHEQNRYDRDQFVNINWNSIPDSVRNNFDKAKPGETTAFDVPYDYGSVMHYSPKAFSNDDNPTIIPLIEDPMAMELMGQRDGFSLADIEKINRMYGCNMQGQQGGGPNGGEYGPNGYGGEYGPGPNYGGEYGPGPQGGNFGPGPQGNYGPGPQGNYGPGPQGNFGPGPQGNYGPGPQGNYGPGPQGNFGPGPQENYGPGPQGGNFGPGPQGGGFRPRPNRPFGFLNRFIPGRFKEPTGNSTEEV